MARSRALLWLAIVACIVATAGAALSRWPIAGLNWLASIQTAAGILGTVALILWLGFILGSRILAGAGQRGMAQLQMATAIVALVVFAIATIGDGGSALLSLGIVGFGLTLALQRPILALGGWLTVFFGRMFGEGDRITVGELTGDVLGISLMTTKLWEIGGPGSTTPGRPTGRIRTVSNALFLEQPVANATSDTATVFDEFVVNVAFESDQARAREILQETSRIVLDSKMHRTMAQAYRRLTRGLPIEKNFPDQPFILAESKPSWMEYRLRYLVDARRASHIQSALTQAWSEATDANPEQFIPVYPRSQSQRINAGGRPIDQ